MADPNTPERKGLTRRQLLAAGGTLATAGSVAAGVNWWQSNECGYRGDVFIGRAGDYEADLVSLIKDGLRTIGVTRTIVRGKRVVLKPNLVETAPGLSHINTHPKVVSAAAEVFRRLDADTVIVAEGQGHRRDSLLVLEESGMQRALDESKLPFVDLNHDEVREVRNRGTWTTLPMYLPRTVLEADLVVSMPKLKTHHWTGVTCAMKNLFGVMPGIVYGWPKNPLHFAGIENSILDICSTVRPGLAIVDGIVGMDGDGPIMGDPRPAGCLIMGRNMVAVDATAVRVMGLEPEGVRYLVEASGVLGPVLAENILQRGERIESVRTAFNVLDLPHLDRRLRRRRRLFA